MPSTGEVERVEVAVATAAEAILMVSADGARVAGRVIRPLRRREAFLYAGAALATLPPAVLAALRKGAA